ncbi:unnamed protein product [Caenorhabditis bovis]|uniref:SAC3/GANP/THP3 conserved domain-containing protein n=1 Tax=Caenorhabditis bovis TaxID=2654633 RepID=A0A8S1FCF7_9PELO|nr:unnamed protein product [Caenorhabditis bovis]
MFGVRLASVLPKQPFGVTAVAEESVKFKVPPRLHDLKSRISPAPRSFSPDQKEQNQEESKILRKLTELQGRECPGDYEKYIVLDERDKLLCQLREVNPKLIARIARCEELCSEKERYVRITQNRVAEFECDEETGEPIHEMMIKEYARSAADQEKSLPHELRSEKMMNQTMSHLLHNFLNELPKTEVEKASWYNFLWSRTRAIRKEVTQLSMSDPLAVKLVERCTRLHILCGYILCTLETEHFDQKMNNENLGKCLQTLRHLYEDFERRGIPCENEAEFRAYDVMMYMNDPNVLSQVLSYKREIRQSSDVCLALQLSTSFQNNNYYRFFRLMKSKATFLQCCVSHKHFKEAREHALTTMTSSYGKNAAYPIEKLGSILAYDDMEDATSEFSAYGITGLEAGQVVLNRDYLTFGEIIPMKCYSWIDAKRNAPYSQVVYGPETFQYFASRADVSNSFDYQNRYRQEEKKIQDLVQKLTMNVIDQIIMNLATEERMKSNILKRQKRQEEMQRKKREEEERLKLERETRKREQEEATSKKIAENIERDTVKRGVEKIILTEMRNERKKRESRIAQKILEKFWQKKVVKMIDSRVLMICEEAIHDKNMIENGLKDFRERISRQWILQFWNRWREVTILKREYKTKRREMLKLCIPKWESKETENDLVRKFETPTDCLEVARRKRIQTIQLESEEKKRKPLQETQDQFSYIEIPNGK